MALGTSNTFILTSAGTALATSRSHLNGSIQAVLQNFYSPTRPTSVNFVDTGGNEVSFINDPRTHGVLHYNSTYRALYINEPTANKKGGEGPGGNFTRVGIGARYEDNIVGATSNIGNYQIGELMVVVGGVASSNARLYMKSANAATEWKDVGIPHTNSVSNTMLIDNAVTTNKIQNGAVTYVKLDSGLTASNAETVSQTSSQKFVTPNSLGYWYNQKLLEDTTFTSNVTANAFSYKNSYGIVNENNVRVDHRPDLYSIGNSGTGTITISPDNGLLQTLTINGSFTLERSTIDSYRVSILTTNDGIGNYTINTTQFDYVLGEYNNTASAQNLFEIVKFGSTSILVITELS